MIRFYPSEIPMFQTDDFDFDVRHHPVITLECKYKFDYKDFYDRHDFIEFLKDRGVRLNDPYHVLNIQKLDDNDRRIIDGITHAVVHYSLLGWKGLTK